MSSLSESWDVTWLSPSHVELPKKRLPKSSGPKWRPTRAMGRALTVIALSLGAAIALGRPDFVIIAVPFVLATVWSLAFRPRQVPTATFELDVDRVSEGDRFSARVEVHNSDPAPIVSIVAAQTGRLLRLEHGAGIYVDRVGHAETATIVLAGTVQRWGRRSIGPVRVQPMACDGLLRAEPLLLPARYVKVVPSAGLFKSDRDLPRAAGMAGIHRSQRLGDSGELAEVRQYHPGDRLRRIDWRVSARQQSLYVNATLSERDADVAIMLDVLHDTDPGPSGNSVMDTTVRAAAAIAQHYAHQGDRVSTIEFGPRMRRLRAGTGGRHVERALEWLLEIRVVPGATISVARLVSGRALPSAAVTFMLTPLLDDRSTEALVTLAQSGRRLIAVDTLPPDVLPPDRDEWSNLSKRLWQVQRANTIDRLRSHGVPVEQWHGAGSIDLALAEVSRMTHAPRVRR